MRDYFIYIMTNVSKTLYVGITNNLMRRILEYRSKSIPGFTKKYNITKLVYFDSTSDARTAIAREKRIKGWRRARKMELINSINPYWIDLSVNWSVEGAGDPSLRSLA